MIDSEIMSDLQILYFSNSLRSLRKAKGWTRDKLAEETDLSFYRRTGQLPRIDTARLIKTLEYEGARDRAISRNLPIVKELKFVLNFHDNEHQTLSYSDSYVPEYHQAAASTRFFDEMNT